MKHFIFLITFSTVLLSLHAKETPLKTNIERATVFTRGAQIFHQGELNLEAGEHLLVFTELSPYLNPSSVQLGGKGSLTILSVSTRLNYLQEQSRNQELASLDKRIAELDAEIEDANTLLSVYADEEDLLLKNKSIRGDENGVDIAQLKIAADYYRLRLTEIRSKKLEIQRKVKSRMEEQQKLRYQRQQLQGQPIKSFAEIVVKVQADKPTKARFNLSYTLNEAGWTPYYDIRMESVDKPLSFELKARVTQNSGIDWNNVQLTLSTGNPAANNALPNIYPWYIDFVYPETQVMNEVSVRGSRAPSESVYVDGVKKDKQQMDDAEIGYGAVSVAEKMSRTEYTLGLPCTITGNNVTEEVVIGKTEIPALYEYRANLRADLTAYLMAKVYGWQDYNLMSGKARLYNEGTFIGEMMLNVQSVEDTLLLSMGRDESIVIKRERIKDVSGNQMIGGSRKISRGWKTTVRNNKKQEIRLVLTDQIPLSVQKDIEVKLEKAEGGKVNETNGFVVYQFNLAPGTGKELILLYNIKYPKDSIINFAD
jgi:uncharacterized protein (TIGR02231 family)